MPPALSDPLEFKPTPRTLAAAIAGIGELGPLGGSAVDARIRRAALRAYASFPHERRPSRGWRYDYAALPYDDLQWSTGRASAPVGSYNPERRDDGAPADAPPLALEVAGGLVHSGSLYLEAQAASNPAGFKLVSLADAKRTMPERVAFVHQRIVQPGADRFSALSTAFQNCGAYVEVAEGARLDAPLQVVWTTRPGAPSAVFPQTVVRIGAGARATIVERHIGSNDAFVAGIVEVDLAAGARLDYVVVQQTGEGTRMLMRRHAHCARGASIGWHLAELGGGLVRSVTCAKLLEPGARAEANVLFFARGFEHVDLALSLQLARADTRSRAVVRGVAFDRAQGRFEGSLRVAPQARGSDAASAFDALGLSPRAFLSAASPLDVAADGVSVSNTAKVGSLARDELFYVQSRGIARRDAEHMIALAFFEPAIRGFPSDALRDEVRAALDFQLDDIPDTFAS